MMNKSVVFSCFVLGSPFTAIVDYPKDPSKIKIKDFLDVLPVGASNIFTIDASSTAKAPIAVILPKDQQEAEVKEVEQRIYRVTYSPRGVPGDIVPVTVAYDDTPILQKYANFLYLLEIFRKSPKEKS